MTYAPATLRALGAYWTKQGGVNLGVVGNAAHTVGYHLGRDRIYSATGDGDKDYSIRLDRDRSGLTDAASAIDLGRLDGTLANLRKFSRWLVAEATEHRTDYRDIREIIYTADGKTVQRWSGVDGLIHTGPGNGDQSHLTHTHISFFRDSEKRDKTRLFAGYFATPPDTGTGDDMPIYSTPGLFSAVWKKGTVIYATATSTTAAGVLSVDKRLLVVGQDAPTAKRYLVDGAGDGPSSAMGWVNAATATAKQSEAVASTGAVEVTLGGRRYIGNVTST